MISYPPDEVTQAPQVDEIQIRNILQNKYGISGGTLTVLTGYEDCNYRLDGATWVGREAKNVIIKVTNPLETRDKKHIDTQIELCHILNQNDVPSPTLVPRQDGAEWGVETVCGIDLPFRVFDILPGKNLELFPFQPALVGQIGELLAKFHNIADKFKDKLQTTHIPYIAPEYVQSIEAEAHRLLSLGLLTQHRLSLLQTVFEEFRSKLVANREKLDTGLIHSDINETNILVSEVDGKLKVTGLLDFGDLHSSFRVLDIGAAVLYLQLSDEMGQGIQNLYKSLIDGYLTIRKFHEEHLVLPAMRARLACSLTYGLRTARINYRNENVEYIMKVQSNGWETLEALSKMGCILEE